MNRSGRLRRAEIDRVFREGIAASGPFFVVRAAPNTLGRTRWAFAVGRKALAKATDRNRLRRRLRAAAAEAGVDASADVVVVARREALLAPYTEVVGEIQRLCMKLGLR